MAPSTENEAVSSRYHARYGSRGGSYISVEMWLRLKRRFGLSIDKSTAGALRAANPADSSVPPMRILGSVPVPVLFENDSRVRTVVVRVVLGLPYAFILGADYFRCNNSTLDFKPARGFRPTPSASWVPFLVGGKGDEPASASLRDSRNISSALREARTSFCHLTAYSRPLSKSDRTHEALAPCPEVPLYEDIAWEDTSSLEWDLRPVQEGVMIDGFTSVAVEAAPVGPMPQDRQLVMVLPKRGYDLEEETAVGVARAVMWWTPGAPIYCKIVNRGN
ncbi:unnamed protein product, partial [Pylaiella littoralis]